MARYEQKALARRGGSTVYEVKVLLAGTEPCVWRRLQVPGNANLNWLHSVIQVAMGWTNSHLHQFICGEHVYVDLSMEWEQYEGDPPLRDESHITLAEVAPQRRNAICYEYDFGDSWEHLVLVERVLPAARGALKTARCVAGERACPPEDCGGIGGYEGFLAALKDRKHPEHRQMKEWIGGSFDAEAFHVEKANFWLGELKWPHVTEAQLRKVLMARDGYHE